MLKLHFMLLTSILILFGCGIQPNSASLPLSGSESLRNDEKVLGSFLVLVSTPEAFSLNISSQSYFHERRLGHELISSLMDREKSVLRYQWISFVGDQKQTKPFSMPFQFGFDEKVFRQPSAVIQVDFSTEAEGVKVLEQWQQDGVVLYYEPNYLSTLSVSDFSLLADEYARFDPGWWLSTINLPKAFQLVADEQRTANANTPIIAVFDSGIDHTHLGLSDRIWQNPYPGIAGCKNDKFGCNTTAESGGFLGDGEVFPYGTSGVGQACPIDQSFGHERPDGNCLHGTHVAGIIAGNVAEGIAGVCPMCRILNVKVVASIKGEAKVSDSSILKGFKYVELLKRQLGVPINVINSSFGKFQKSRSLSLIINSLQRKGVNVLLVGAAGNEDGGRPVYPAAEDVALAVSAIGKSGRKAKYANYGVWVDLVAPGGDLSDGGPAATILSSIPGGGVEFSQGTSMATPMVSGVAGLVLAFEPELTASDLKQRLIASSQPILYDARFAGGYNARLFFPRIKPEGKRVPLLGGGIIDAEAALANRHTSSFDYILNDRVVDGCGVIEGGDGNTYLHGYLVVMLILGLPFLLMVIKNMGKRLQRLHRIGARVWRQH